MSAAVLLAVFALTTAASAQSASPGDSQDPEARRTAIYGQGVDAAAHGQWAEAKDRFTQALAIRVSPKVLFSLGQTEEKLGEVAGAAEDYRRALDAATAAGEQDVVAAANQALAAIEPRVPKVRVLVPGSSTATITLDGRLVTQGAPVPVEPGTHKVRVDAPGMSPASAVVAISEGQRIDLPMRLESAAKSPTALAERPSSPPRGASPWRTAGVVIAVAGVVTLGVGGGLGLLAISKNDESNTAGCSGDYCTPQGAAIRRDALTAANAATVAFVAGGVLTAAGVALWIVAPSSGKRAVSVAPMALASGAGLMVGGRW